MDDASLQCCANGLDTSLPEIGSDLDERVAEDFRGLRDIVRMQVGIDSAFVLNASGTGLAWGGNQAGELGLGDTEPRTWPELVPGITEVTDIAAGDFHACALTKGGVWCWGDGDWGATGIAGAARINTTPRLLAGLPPLVSIAAGSHHTCGLDHDGQVWCWGDNDFRQVDPSLPADTVYAPVPVRRRESARLISAGRRHTCMVSHDGRVSCWGAVECGERVARAPRAPQ